jgi:hypothetical protein
MQWGAAHITVLPATEIPAFIAGPATVAAGTVTTVASGTITINGTLAVAGTLVLGPGVVIYATSLVLIGAVNMSASASLSSGTFSIQPSAVLTVVVDMNPGTNSSITVVVAQFASFGGGSFGNSSAQATYIGAQCVQLGSPEISISSSALSATISVTPFPTVPGCGSGGLTTAQLIGVIVGTLAGALLVALAFALCIPWLRNRQTKKLNHALRVQEMEELYRRAVL